MPRLLRVLPLLAVAAVFIGVVASARALRDITRIRKHIGDKVERVNTLEGLRTDRPASPPALRALDALPTQEPENLETLCAELLEGVSYQYEPQGIESAGAAWLTRRVRIRMDRVDLERLGRLVARVEAGRPPWRITECSIEALSSPGTARVTLDLEALHKEDI